MSTQVRTATAATNPDVDALVHALHALRANVLDAPGESKELLDAVHENYHESARNLLHYLALRRHDLRPLQLSLAKLGLSSLGRAESHVLSTLEAVLSALCGMTGRAPQASQEEGTLDFVAGERLLAKHTEVLFGRNAPERSVRVMVTMPSEAAIDYALVHALLQQGMDCMRINCAHDDASKWLKMIEHLRRAEAALNRRCRVAMDLAGPKLRTGPLQPGPAVLRIRPRRDVYGLVVAPARIWLTSDATPQSSPSLADASLCVSTAWLTKLRRGDCLHFTDAREAKRTFDVVDVTGEGCWAESSKTSYVVKGTRLRRSQDSEVAEVTNIPCTEQPISLRIGDRLTLTRDLAPGRIATHDRSGAVLTPARVGCTIPEVFDDVKEGEAIWFDDGKIGGLIEEVDKTRVQVRITHARTRGAKLYSDKGINLPDSNLRLPALTRKDLDDLEFVVRHADIVELSFANSVEDVESLQAQIARLGPNRPAIVLKIETRRGFENLPEMLLAAMRSPMCGIMIARGDLAVECGFERLAEVQEEILWVCEAAHVPVIWATQVLETLSRDGMPSRAEITDAAMAHRAECVMLNKGPHVVTAVRVLDDILRRMQTHQVKKRAMLRELRMAHLE